MDILYDAAGNKLRKTRFGSPLIAAASAGYPEIHLYPAMDYDNELLLDLMQEQRPVPIAD